jgi:hypothetical protein
MRALAAVVALGLAMAVAPVAVAADVSLTVVPDQTEVPPGGQVEFSALFLLPAETVTVESLTSAALGDLTDPGNPGLESTTCDLPVVVGPDDSFGAYDFGCTYVVRFDGAPGARPDTVTAVVRRASSSEVTVTAPADVTVSADVGALVGRVTDDVTGAPVDGVRVLAWGPAGSSRGDTTDASGHYGFSGLVPGAYRLHAGNLVELVPSEYAPEWYRDRADAATADTVAVVGGETSSADLALALGGRITGRVTDAATGTPVEGADVSHRDAVLGGPMGGHGTDATGRYTVAGLPSGTFEVCASLPGYRSACVTGVDVTVRETTAGVDLLLVRESAARLTVAVEVVGEAFLGGPVTARILVGNVGAEAATDVVVDPESEGCSAAVSAPVVVVGDADDVLEPGESWAYTCGRPSVVVGVVRVQVTATAPGGVPVEADGHLVFELADPVTVTVTPSATSVLAGAVVDWVIDLRNVGPYPMVGAAAEARVLYPDWTGPVPYADADGPEPLDGDADAVLEPGEVWRFALSLPVMVPGSYLDVAARAAPAASPGTGLAFTGRSAVIVVTAVPDGTELPDTGAPGHLRALVPVGLGLVLGGAGLVAVARRWRSTA